MADKGKDTPSEMREAMLNWYDRNARSLPWRSQPFERPNPYHIWLSEVMLQQTTVGAVKPYFEKFIHIWPSVLDLAQASQKEVLKEWAGLGYYSRARNLHKCAKELVERYKGQFPSDKKTLQTLPGIGDYTSSAIASIAFDMPETVIDGNVERVVSRLYKITTPLPDSKPEIRVFAEVLFRGSNRDRPSCFAQSMMDLGATICTPKSPKCMLCPLQQFCLAYKHGEADMYPIKKPKKVLPEKHAVAYIFYHDNKVGIETRPEKGMLGGMTGFPTSEWKPVTEQLTDDYRSDLKIRHVFTHFVLTVYPKIIMNKTETMVDVKKIDEAGLPTLFQKLWNMIKSEL